MEADPFQKNPAACHAFGDSKYLDTIPAGSVLIWDAHFGANESKVPLDSLLMNKRQRVINYFRPDEPWLTFGGGWYDCYVTLTMNPGETCDNYTIRDSIREFLDARRAIKTLYTNTFENPGDAWDMSYLSTGTVHQGKYAFRMDQRTEFSPGCTLPVSVIPSAGTKAQLLVSLYLDMPKADPTKNTLLVISFEHRNKPYSYTSVNLNILKTRPCRWDRVTLATPLPGFVSPKDLLKVYIWNPGRQLFYVDDIKVRLTP